ncbi:MAG: hypothetical protein IJ744_11495 [Lachnospiraceae bacterium]|nr:hypothetical protein [Lachnospiraceae bacterium]
MLTQMHLTPEELYFLGKRLSGEYLDYAYLAMMRDIGQKRAMEMDQISAALGEKGYLSETLWGEEEVPEDVRAFLAPVFSSGRQMRIQVIKDNPTPTVQTMWLHLGEAHHVVCIPVENELHLQKITEEELPGVFLAALPEDFLSQTAPEALSGEAFVWDAAMTFSYVQVGVRKDELIYYQRNHGLYEMTEAGVRSVAPWDVWERIQTVLGGEGAGILQTGKEGEEDGLS